MFKKPSGSLVDPVKPAAAARLCGRLAWSGSFRLFFEMVRNRQPDCYKWIAWLRNPARIRNGLQALPGSIA